MACHAGGRGFESRPLRQQIEALSIRSGLFVFISSRKPRPMDVVFYFFALPVNATHGFEKASHVIWHCQYHIIWAS